MMLIQYHSIGTIHSPFTKISDMPIQPSGAVGVPGSIEINEELVPALQDLNGFSHLILLYHFHQVKESKLQVTPFLDTQSHGLFATRAPQRPNPIGCTVVRLLDVTKNCLIIENVDVLDGTPLLDIKPYVPAFDGEMADLRIGWLEGQSQAARTIRSDDRFGE
jgi:tRNA-Thr(GGU) m(6)t(6)A37 methyltransferase TsaA